MALRVLTYENMSILEVAMSPVIAIGIGCLLNIMLLGRKTKPFLQILKSFFIVSLVK